GVPVGTTVWRLLTRLDDGLLSTVLAGWLTARAQPVTTPQPRRYRTVIAVDGKTLRGARRSDGGQVHLLSALDTSTGIVLAQVTVSAKSNEIPAFAPLLDAVETVLGTLTGLLFIADALHTQTAHADEIAARGAHLMIPTKGNQPTLFAQLKALPWPDVPLGDRRRDTGHGRRETRTVKAITVHTPAESGSPTRSRPSGSSGPAPPAGRPAARPPTSPCLYPPSRPNPPTCRTGPAANGTSRTASTTSGTSRSVKTSTKLAPAPDPPSWPPCATPRSATTAPTARPTSPAPPDAPTAAHTTSSPP
ncbi:ISAs1 family transposase, partial [Micromonospora sp. ATA51]|uniref:ISAs1 family transposase n=1 Tax=Micromonospora sp. ATA51 TaxID=2806098 RepID=UPI001A539169|nr:ISAs1 family transposase [Micromonospora sp. ATA51]